MIEVTFNREQVCSAQRVRPSYAVRAGVVMQGDAGYGLVAPKAFEPIDVLHEVLQVLCIFDEQGIAHPGE